MTAAAATTKQFGNTVLDAGTRNREGFTSLGLGAAAMGVAIVGGLKIATDAAMDFESSFAGVRKTVDGSDQELDAIAQGMRDLSKEIPVNVNELNRIGESAGQLGVQKSAILGFTDTVAKMGVTTDLVGDQAANAFARLHNIMQVSQDDFDRTGSTIVALGNAGASTESEIAEFGLRIAGAGKIAGLTLPNVLAIGNAFSSVGIEAEAGGTATQKVLLSITDAVNTGGAKLEKFAETAGMSAQEFAAQWRSDPITAFTAFVEGLGTSGQQAMGVLKELGLTDQRLIRSFLSLAGAGDVLRDSVDLGTKAWDENVALQKEAEKRFETTASKVQLAKNNLNDFAISIGNVVLPALGWFAEKVTAVADVLGDLPGPIRTTLVVAGGLAGVFLLVGGAMLLLIPRIAATKTAMASLNMSFASTRAAGSKMAGFMGGPWGMALMGATLVLGAFINKQAAAKEAVNQYTSAIEADTGAIGENTRALAAHRLEQSGALKAAQELGVELTTLVDASLGNAQAAGEVRQALVGGMGEHRDAVLELSSAFSMEGTAAKEGEAAYKREKEAVEGSADAHGKAKGPTDELAGAMGELAGETEDTATAAERLNEAITTLIGFKVDAEKALIDFKDSLADLTKGFKDNGTSLDINTAKGRLNRENILSSIDAARSHAEAVADQSGSVKKGADVLIDHVNQLKNQARQAGISEQAINNYIRELNLTPKEIRTAIRIAAQQAKNEINTVQGMLTGLKDKYIKIIATSSVDPLPPNVKRAGGGPVYAGHTYLVGESGVERFSPYVSGNITPSNQLAAPAKVLTSSVNEGPNGMSGFWIEGVLQIPGFGRAQIRGVVRDELNADSHWQGRGHRRRSAADA